MTSPRPPQSTSGAGKIIVCDWLPPAFGAVGQYMMQRARRIAATGAPVVLIGLGDRRETRVEADGLLTIVQLAARRPKRTDYLKRALWALSCNFRLAWAVRRETRRRPEADLLVTGSPPFLAHLLILANLAWRRKLTYRITDFYPETAIASGHARFLRLLIPLFHWLRRRADVIEILGEDQRRRLLARGLSADRLELVRDGSPVEIDTDTPAAPRPFDEGDILLLYSGNMGVAHDIDAFCDAYCRHIQEGSNRVRLWVNGAGVRVGQIQAFCEAHRLPLHVTPPAPIEHLAGILRAADAHLILLGDAYWGYVLPSKVFACLSTGEPIVYVGPSESDIALLVAERGHPDSAVVAPGDVQAAFLGLERLSSRQGRR